MIDLQPLYIDGKRDSRRRYVTPDGEIIQPTNIKTGRVTLKKRRSGVTRKGRANRVTVRRHQRREERKKKGVKQATIELGVTKNRLFP